MTESLHARYETMTYWSIISELEKIHQFYAVASWAPRRERGGYFYKIAKALGTASIRGLLVPQEVERIVAMLLWDEFRKYKDRSAPFHFVAIAKRNPRKEFIPILAEHFGWLRKEIATLAGGTHYYAGVASEIKMTEEAIDACRSSGSEVVT